MQLTLNVYVRPKVPNCWQQCLVLRRLIVLRTGEYATAMSDLDIEIPNASNFTVPPTLYNDPARIATLARSDGSFTLCINSTGVVSCSGAAKICGGYAPGGTGVCP